MHKTIGFVLSDICCRRISPYKIYIICYAKSVYKSNKVLVHIKKNYLNKCLSHKAFEWYNRARIFIE